VANFTVVLSLTQNADSPTTPRTIGTNLGARGARSGRRACGAGLQVLRATPRGPPPRAARPRWPRASRRVPRTPASREGRARRAGDPCARRVRPATGTTMLSADRGCLSARRTQGRLRPVMADVSEAPGCQRCAPSHQRATPPPAGGSEPLRPHRRDVRRFVPTVPPRPPSGRDAAQRGEHAVPAVPALRRASEPALALQNRI
jgi:hypothetical protein